MDDGKRPLTENETVGFIVSSQACMRVMALELIRLGHGEKLTSLEQEAKELFASMTNFMAPGALYDEVFVTGAANIEDSFAQVREISGT